MTQLTAVLALVVMACSASTESRSRESVPPQPVPEIVAIDAAEDATNIVVDARVPVSEVTAVDAAVGEPVGAAFPGYTVRAPPPTIYAISSLYARVEGIVVAIAITEREGVTKDWKFHLIDKDGRALRDGELTVTAVDRLRTWASTELLLDWIPSDVRAQLDSYSY